MAAGISKLQVLLTQVEPPSYSDAPRVPITSRPTDADLATRAAQHQQQLEDRSSDSFEYWALGWSDEVLHRLQIAELRLADPALSLAAAEHRLVVGPEEDEEGCEGEEYPKESYEENVAAVASWFVNNVN